MQAERIDYGMRHGAHAGMHALSDSMKVVDKYIYKYLAQLLNVCIIEIE